ncbi:hypothetical protein QWZ13_05810 [Reinekea marina]|uniref:Uncharacterized protein n=1 Tax=Reinekea marina TaxID=1310421 RepID=A0ABV7WP16_9GAMM|nr:hypothetical protein [Reinekea marina]MDN3648421.1 hypothetical protein [Reinekea marina]
MNTYFVTRWGNDSEGPNEADTNFFVIANDYLEAARTVDEVLSKVDHSLASKFCQRVTELGVSHSILNKPIIISGPSIEYALYHDSLGIPDDKKWVRDILEEGWENYSDCY